MSSPKILYRISFLKPIGENLKEIICSSYISGNRIYAVWDSIEDCLRKNTNYQTMFDIYGHFTEPHPIFRLETTVLEDDQYFNISRYFSDAKNCNKILARTALSKIMGIEIENSEEFIKIAKHLREIRFDIRVNQTNPKIPTDHFSFSYPFSLSLSRQTAITWDASIPSEETR